MFPSRVHQLKCENAISPSGLDFQSTFRGWWCSPRKSRYFVISDLSWFYLKFWTSGEKASGVSERHLLPLGLCRRVKIFSLSKLKTQIFLFAVLPNHQNVSIFRIQVCGGGRGPTNRTGWIWAGSLMSCQKEAHVTHFSGRVLSLRVLQDEHWHGGSTEQCSR